MDVVCDTQTEVYRLLPLCAILRKLESFSHPVHGINFTTRSGWGGKVYVANRLDACVPTSMRGCELLEVHYLKPEDRVHLTIDQWADFKRFSL